MKSFHKIIVPLAAAFVVAACTNIPAAPEAETAAVPEPAQLSLEIFVAEPAELNVTSAMIMGPTEMMVVSAQGTKSSAARLADEIEATGLDLKYIFLTHPHLDHAQGAGVLKERFPEARFIATPVTAFLQRNRIPSNDAFAQVRYGDNAAVPSIPAEGFHGNELLIDGEEVEIWSGLVGDSGGGLPTEPHSAIYVPSLNAFMPSDIIYFNGHIMMGGSTPESRAQWVAQIERWQGMDFDTVVPGHIPSVSLKDLTAEGALAHSRDYVLAYDKARVESETSEELIETMIELYPDALHQSALYLSAYIDFQERDKALAYISGWQEMDH